MLYSLLSFTFCIFRLIVIKIWYIEVRYWMKMFDLEVLSQILHYCAYSLMGRCSEPEGWYILIQFYSVNALLVLNSHICFFSNLWLTTYWMYIQIYLKPCLLFFILFHSLEQEETFIANVWFHRRSPSCKISNKSSERFYFPRISWSHQATKAD